MIKIVILCVLFLFSAQSLADTIELSEKNHTALLGVVDRDTVDQVINDINKLPGDEVFVYIDSPGGDVFAGLVLVNYILTSNKKITCIANEAASMAHQILQACHVRVGTTHNMLMQHKLKTTFEGNPADLKGQLAILESLEEYLDTLASNRIGITLAEYQRRTAQPWYTFGNQSLEQNVIDKISLVKCSKSLYDKKSTKTVETMFGAITLVQSGCPLMPAVRS